MIIWPAHKSVKSNHSKVIAARFLCLIDRLYMKKIICLLILGLMPVCAHAQEATPEPESPWILAPTVSSDPKLGTSLGLVGGYLYSFDAESTQSMFMAGIHFVIAMIWQGGLVVMVNKAKELLSSDTFLKAVEGATGAVLIGLGVKLLVDES